MNKERIYEILEDLGWNYHEYNDYIEISQESPAGEDFSFTVSAAEMAKDIKNYAFEFDPDEHAEMWIAARHNDKSVPQSVRTLLKDAESIQKMLYRLSDKIDQVERKDARKKKCTMSNEEVFRILTELGWSFEEERKEPGYYWISRKDCLYEDLVDGNEDMLQINLKERLNANFVNRYIRENYELIIDNHDYDFVRLAEEITDSIKMVRSLASRLEHPDQDIPREPSPSELFINGLLEDTIDQFMNEGEKHKAEKIRSFQQTDTYRSFCTQTPEEIHEKMLDQMSPFEYMEYRRTIKENIFCAMAKEIPEFQALYDDGTIDRDDVR